MAKRLKDMKSSSVTQPPMLKAVSLVCGKSKHIVGLSHVAALVDSFIDCSEGLWDLESATKVGSLRLMEQLKQEQWIGVSVCFRLSRVKNALKEVTASGNMQLLDWWTKSYLSNAKEDLNGDIFRLAMKHGELKVLKWLGSNLRFRMERDLCFAPCDSLEIGLWLHERLNGKRFSIRLHSLTGEIDFEFMKWAHAHHQPQFGFHSEETTLSWLIRRGRLEELAWWYQNLTQQCSPVSLDEAIQHGQLPVLKWLIKHHPKVYFDDPAFGCRDLEIVKWFCLEYEWKEEAKKTVWIQSSIDCAAAFEDAQDVITFLLNAWPNVDCAHAMSIAAQHGHLPLVQFLHNHDAKATTDAMNRAAWNGHMTIVQWLHDNRSEGCTTQAMNLAAAANRLEVVQWLHANRTEGCTTIAMDEAATNGHLEMVQWLHEHRSEGCTADAMDKAAAAGYFDVVKWLHENRSEGCTSKAIEEVACTGRLDIAQYLHDHVGKRCTYLMLKNAMMNGHLSILRWGWEEAYADFDVDTWHDTAADGPIGVVPFLVLEGSVFNGDDDVYEIVARAGHFTVLIWLLKNLKETSRDLVDNAFIYRPLSVAEHPWLLLCATHATEGSYIEIVVDEIRAVAVRLLVAGGQHRMGKAAFDTEQMGLCDAEDPRPARSSRSRGLRSLGPFAFQLASFASRSSIRLSII